MQIRTKLVTFHDLALHCVTTIKIGNAMSQINCGSYGTLVFSSQKGYVVGVPSGNLISSDTPVAGYFLEDITTAVSFGDLLLFNVQGNYEFS